MQEAHPAEVEPGDLERWMVLYQQGNAPAVTRLIETLSPQFFQFFLAQVRERSGAEDLLQEFWLRVHHARKTYRPDEPLLPWLYAIARYARIDYYRKARRRASREIQVESLPEPVPHAQREPAGPDLAAVLDELPPSQKDVIVMLKVSGMSLEEVARATHSSVGSVKQKAHRGYTKLRSLLERRWGKEPPESAHAT